MYEFLKNDENNDDYEIENKINELEKEKNILNETLEKEKELVLLYNFRIKN